MKTKTILVLSLLSSNAIAQSQDPFAPGGLDTESSTTQVPESPPSRQPSPPTPPPTPPSSGMDSSPTSRSNQIDRNDDALALEESIRNQYIEGQFEYQDAELQDVVKAISKLTKKNFILDPKVRGKITIISPAKVTVQEVYEAFLSTLEINEYTLVSAGKYLKIIRHQDAARSNIKTYSGEFTPDNDNYITRIYPLKYISAEDVARELRELTPRYGKITPYGPTNTVVITDTGRNIRRLIQIIKLLDVRGFELELEVIPIRHAPAKELAGLIDSIISESATETRPVARRANQRSGVKKTQGGGEIAKIVPEERTNSLIVLANAQGVREVRGLINKLDISEPLTQSGRIHVYYCQHTDATELAQTLAALSGGRSGQSNIPTRSGSRPATPDVPGGVAAATGQMSAEFEGGVKITADKATNSLVIVASRADYDTLLKVINRLDIPRKQVYVEAIVMEVKVNDTFNFGVHYNYAAEGIPRVVGFSPNADLLDYFNGGVGLSGLVLGIAQGESKPYTVAGKTVNIKSVTSLITAVQTYSETNILSTPQVMAIDNEESEIKITDKIPVAAGSSASQGAVSTNVTEKNLGMTLKLTPQISGDVVRMKLETSFTNVSSEETPKGLSDSNISTAERSAKTVVVIPNSDTVVIGGLMQENIVETQRKIPLLGDIPILGWLFKGTQKIKRKTNLLIFITPTIVDNHHNSAALTEKTLDTRQEYLKANLGGSDAFKKHVEGIRTNISLQKQRPLKPDSGKNLDAPPIEGSFEKEEVLDDMSELDPLPPPTIADTPPTTPAAKKKPEEEELKKPDMKLESEEADPVLEAPPTTVPSLGE